MLFEDLSNQPHMAERVYNSALQHTPDRARTRRGVRVLSHRVLGNSARRYRPALHGLRIVHKEFDSDGSEPCVGWTTRTVLGRFRGEEESSTMNRETRDNMLAAAEVPKHVRIERVL